MVQAHQSLSRQLSSEPEGELEASRHWDEAMDALRPRWRIDKLNSWLVRIYPLT